MEAIILDQYGDVLAALEWISKHSSNTITLDLETDNKEEIKANIYGIALCVNDEQSFYIPFRNPNTSSLFSNEQETNIIKNIHKICSNKELTGHNIIYDVLVLKHRTNVDFISLIQWDTILLKHLLDEERPFGLKELGVKEFGEGENDEQTDLKENVKSKGGRWTKDEKDMWMADTHILGTYACKDVNLTYRLLQRYLPKVKQQNLLKFYEEETLPLYKLFTIPMKLNGVPVDVNHFYKLKQELTQEIEILENKIYEEITPLTTEWEYSFIEKETSEKPSADLINLILKDYGISLPLSKVGKPSIAKPGILKLLNTLVLEDESVIKNVLLWSIGEGECPLYKHDLFFYKKQLFLQKNEQKYLFNINSNMHLGWLFFEKLNCKPLSKTDGGQPRVDDDFLESIKTIPFITHLSNSKKLKKLLSTYVEGFIEKFHDERIYPSFLQFGTTSGRYSCTAPNLQNLPSLKDGESDINPLVLKYANQIRVGIKSPEGCLIVNSDFSSLEPICFSIASGEKLIQEVFHNKWDLYSQIAIRTFNVTDSSADKKATNYLKNLHPTLRQKGKGITLSIPYGSESSRVSQMLSISREEAQQIIDDYLDGFPQLAKWMEEQKQKAIKDGQIVNMFGRIRHLPRAKSLYNAFGERLLDYKWARSQGLTEERSELKNLINLSRNYPIQSLAASIVNRSAIEIMKQINKESLPAYPILQVHDELTFVCKEEFADEFIKIVKHHMENTIKLPVALSADPLKANNWGDAK